MQATRRIKQNDGFTMIELVIVIIILGIIGAMATRKMTGSIDNARYEQTKTELDQLAKAIAGNPALHAKGARTDFGYVGDVGSLPPDLDALVSNPGGYTTWNGPYIETGLTGDEYKRDGWSSLYVYTDTLLRSTGSGSNIDKTFAPTTSGLLSNSIEGFVLDASGQMPGPVYKDSMTIQAIYPNGSGGMALASVNPTSDGSFFFGGIPVGNHTLRVIYVPDSDTIIYPVCVLPSRASHLQITFPADLW